MSDLRNRFAHPLSMASTSTVLRLLLASPGVSLRYLPRALRVTFMSLLNSPWRVIEALRYRGLVARTTIDKPPVFVLGHWRTGTTHLQNLLTLDPRFGYLTSFQAFMHGLALLDWPVHRKLMSMLMPAKRPMDELPVSTTSPSEEEFAVASEWEGAIINGLWFPQRLRSYADDYMFFDNGTARRESWKATYHRILKKTYLLNGKKQLVLKNPANTARVPALLELFPNAKFIHIRRDPQLVYPSTVRLYEKLMEHRVFQDFDRDELRETVLYIFNRMFERFDRDAQLIPRGHLVELRCEDLERRPIEELRRIYATLDLGDFGHVEPLMRSYLGRTRDYKPNVHAMDVAQQALVRAHWGRAIDAWGYGQEQLRESQGAPH